ncbi:hypothetical protein V2J09_017024 [Rumex salicifolius]
MIAIIWNCRGAGKPSLIRTLKYMVNKHRADLVVLLETQVCDSRADVICRKLNFDSSFRADASGRAGGIWVLFNASNLDINLVNKQENFISVTISNKGKLCSFCFAYAPPSAYRRRVFWRDIETELISFQGPCFFGGDLNCILRDDERSGGSGALHPDSNIFQDMVDNVGLIDMGFSGQPFTWSRGSSPRDLVAKRLDRMFMNMEAFVAWPTCSIRHLPKLCSDHTPLLFKLDPIQKFDRSRRPFRFEAVWFTHPQFHDFIRSKWNSRQPVNIALMELREHLTSWNSSIFGNINAKKATLTSLLDSVQVQLASYASVRLLEQEDRIRRELDDVLFQEEILWKQKSKEAWLKDGDRNTKFFHTSTLIRRKANRVVALKREDSSWIFQKEELEDHVVGFFADLYHLPMEDCFPIEIGREVGFEITEDLGSYLGIPLLHKRMDRATFQPIIQKMKARLAGWKGKLLSRAGRVTLANSVLTSIPVYTMATLPLPIAVCDDIDRISRDFIWGSSLGERRMHLVGWDEISKPKHVGGLGVRRMLEVNLALNGKLAWRFLNGCGGLWTEVLRAKYIRPNLRPRSDPSPVWRSVARGVSEVITRGAKWQVGDGSMVRFWSDPWIGDTRLRDWAVGQLNPAQLELPVRHFWSQETGWRWDLFANYLSADICLRIAATSLGESHLMQDVLSWAPTPDGAYSVTSAYTRIHQKTNEQHIDSPVFRCIWKMEVQERVRFFVWLTVRGCILTNSERVRRHLAVCDLCPVCHLEPETLDHLFRRCPGREALWTGLEAPPSLMDFDAESFPSWLRLNILSKRVVGENEKWAGRFAYALWFIWWWRNSWVFRHEEFHGHRVEMVLSRHREYLRSVEKGRTLQEPERREVQISWCPPALGWVRLNTDGAVRDGRAAAGGVIRDSSGTWLGGFTRSIGICSVPAAELWGILSGLTLAWDLGFRKVCVDTDSLLAFRLINKPVDGAHPLSSLLTLVKDSIGRRWDVRLRHCYREGNRVADDLADFAFSFPIGFHVLEGPPCRSLPLLLDDVRGVSLPRLVAL